MNTQIHFGFFKSSLGLVAVAASARGVCSITLGDSAAALARDLGQRFREARLTRDDAKLRRELDAVAAFIDDPARGLDLPLDLVGTDFQRRVWRALREIPAGETLSYAEVARRIDAPKSFRAVAQACGANRIALAIPCHRVVRGDGGISGYRWGVDRKRVLLEREARS
ncbi:MAG: methylated-DNA--[protein]-cysteine S-methyltransferase [Steroidobacteraceae bacterium]|nr:methylated-DNA--[protein]-cysteine S-methyltransferase [Steroidobacteraceae bacterium]